MGEGGEQRHCQNDAASDDFPQGGHLTQQKKGIDNAVDCFHPGDDAGGLCPDAFLGGHIQGVGKGRTETSHEHDPRHILGTPHGFHKEQGGEQKNCRCALLVQTDGPSFIVLGKIPVRQGQDRIGEAAEHAPQDAKRSLVLSGKLRNGDHDACQQKNSAEDAASLEFLMECQWFQEGEKQREGGKGNGADGHGGDLNGLEKGGPVDRHDQTGQKDQDIVFCTPQPEPVPAQQSHPEKNQRGADHPAEGDHDRRYFHVLGYHAGYRKQHDGDVQKGHIFPPVMGMSSCFHIPSPRI